jgi:hypothetical protein
MIETEYRWCQSLAQVLTAGYAPSFGDMDKSKILVTNHDWMILEFRLKIPDWTKYLA